jgi:hypothetical protein
MTWRLNGVRIYVEDDSGWQPNPRKGEINLLDTEYTIVHHAGRESHRRELGFVVFSGYYENILPLANMDSISLEDDEGATTDVTVISLTPERLYDYLDRNIHRVKVELLQDDS